MGFFGALMSVARVVAPIAAVVYPPVGVALTAAVQAYDAASAGASAGQIAQVGASAVSDYRQAEEAARRDDEQRQAQLSIDDSQSLFSNKPLMSGATVT